jgi:hypothetical protein
MQFALVAAVVEVLQQLIQVAVAVAVILLAGLM